MKGRNVSDTARTTLVAYAIVAAALLIGVSRAGAEGAPADSARYTIPVIEVEGEALHTSADRGARHRMDGRQLRRFLPLSTTEALTGLPGVDVIKTGPWSSRPSVRGLSGQRVAVLVDGVPLAPPRGHGAEPSLVPFDDLDAVELAAGASSVEAGSGALGGVLNLITRRLEFSAAPSAGAHAEVRGSSPGDGWYSGARIGFSRAMVAGQVSLGASGLRALVTPDATIDRSGFGEAHGAGRARFKRGVYDLQLQGDHNRADAVELPAFASPAGGFGRYPFNQRRGVRAELTRRGTRIVPPLSVLAARQEFDLAFVEQSVDSVFVRGRFAGTRTERSRDDLTSSDEIARIKLEGQHVVAWNLEAGWGRADTRGPRASDLKVRNRSGDVVGEESSLGTAVPPADRTSLHAALLTQRELGCVRLAAGLRHERTSVHADSNVTNARPELNDEDHAWAGNLETELRARGVTFFARSGSAFRAPSLDERFFDGYVHGALRVFGAHDLAPERSRSLDVGLSIRRWVGSTRLRGRVTVYRNDVRDLVSLVYIGQLYLVPRFQYTNVTRARLSGVELECSAERYGMRVAVNASAPRGRDLEAGQPLNGVGGDRLGLDIRAPIPFGTETHASLLQRWVGETRAADDLLARPGYDTTAFELSSRLITTEVTFVVRNLLDRRYRESLSLIDEPARTFALSVRRDWSWSRAQKRTPVDPTVPDETGGDSR